MGLFTNWKSWFVCHLLLGYIFIMSGLITCFLLLLTYIFVWHFNKTLYRKMCSHIAYMWWSQFTFICQWWADSRVSLRVDHPDVAKKLFTSHTIVIMNHKYEVDWLITWCLTERLGTIGGTKIYGKSMLKYIPILGWVWSFTESIFLKREWEKDRKILQRGLAYICEYPEDYWVTLLLCCEGTRFTESKREASNEVARKKGLKELKHHLLPRAKGFVLSMHSIKEHIDVVTDMTVGFTDEGAEPTFMNVLCGRKIVAEIYTRCIPTKDIPLDTDEACTAWLQTLYQEKDEIFDNFVKNDNHYTLGTRVEVPRRKKDLIMWIFWAVVLTVPLFKYLVYIAVSGSLLSQAVLLIAIGLLTFGLKLMIGVSQIEKSSDYGLSPVQQLRKKNTSPRSE